MITCQTLPSLVNSNKQSITCIFCDLHEVRPFSFAVIIMDAQMDRCLIYREIIMGFYNCPHVTLLSMENEKHQSGMCHVMHHVFCPVTCPKYLHQFLHPRM